MQVLKSRSLLSLASGTNIKNVIRTVTVSSAAIDVNAQETQQLKSWKEIPGPSTLPIIGPLLHFLPGGELQTDGIVRMDEILYKNYGPIARLEGAFGSRTIIFLYDAETCSQVLRAENWLPIRPGFDSLQYYRDKLKKDRDPEKPSGLLSDHGEIWKKFRSTVNPIMLQPKTIRLYSGMLSEIAEETVERLKSLRDENNMIKEKLDIEMNLWALESIGLVALGRRLNCFDPNLPSDSSVRKLINNVHEIFQITSEVDMKPNLWRYWRTPSFKRAIQAYEEQQRLSKYFIGKAIEELKTKKSSNGEKGVLEKLLEIDENIAVIMASDMLFAGVDTTANTILATLYLLAINPDKQSKLREEVMSQQERRPYLRACIKESTRILPVAAGNMRKTTKEYNLMGYKIPKNMHVMFAHQLISGLETNYPKPKQFIPERWLVEKDDPIHHGNSHPFAFLPFGFGARSCIGRRIAELEIETLISKMVENFKIEWVGPPLKMKMVSLTYAIGPYNYVFKDIE